MDKRISRATMTKTINKAFAKYHLAMTPEAIKTAQIRAEQLGYPQTVEVIVAGATAHLASVLNECAEALEQDLAR